GGSARWWWPSRWGGKHVNYNFGLWRKDIAEALDASATADLISRIGRLGPRLDIISIERQPTSWHDVPNPLRLLPHHATPSFGWRGRLAADPAAYLSRLMSADTRNKFRRKERKLAALPGYRYARVASPAEAGRMLDAHFAQKAARMRAAGLGNVYAEPGVEAFLRDAACHGIESGRPLLECHALMCDDEVIAVVCALRDERRCSCMQVSITGSDNARFSPGVLLFINLATACCEDGLDWFDLGVGEASYKGWFCDEAEPLFDSCLPVTAAGRLMAAGQRHLSMLKRHIKRSPRLWNLVLATRRRLFASPLTPP
ncbi:MAG: GNAT family N-acetyltransferase, partial [Bacteroidales bacterium]|nr:GNAT family N-acetyltransferase [Bacteroidales bacterium]